MFKFAANLSMLFTEVDFMERFSAAADAGFQGVEYLFPYDFSADEIAKQLEDNNLTQILFNLPAGDWNAGERGIACHPDRVEEFQAGVDKAIEFAQKLNCSKVNCLVGIQPDNVTMQQAHDTVVSNLRFAAEKLHAANIEFVFEAINTLDIPGFFVTGTEQAKKIISEVNHPNLTMQYDIYHMQIMEGDIARTMENNLASIGHIQLADNPGRHEPGTGEINYSFLFQHLTKINYQGWIGCEYKPKSNTVDGLNWLKNYV